MRISSCFPSKYLKAADLHDRDVSVVMDYVEMEDIGDREPKPVLYFQSTSKGLVLNKINSRVISHAFGDETGNWKGQTITLVSAMVDYRGETVPAIRVRASAARPAERPRTVSPSPQSAFRDDLRRQREIRSRPTVVWDTGSEREPTAEEIDELAQRRADEWGDAQGERLLRAVDQGNARARAALDTTEQANGVPAFLDRRPGAEMLM